MSLKITTFNIEWMNDLFYPNEPRLKTSHKQGKYTGSAIKDMPALCSRIQGTIREIDLMFLCCGGGLSFSHRWRSSFKNT